MYVVALSFVPVVSIDHFLPFSPMSALSALGARLERAAFDLNPSLPIFFLALFYVSSLFPRGSIGRDLYRRESLIVKMSVRMFMVGFMLATKWLDDCTYHAKTL